MSTMPSSVWEVFPFFSMTTALWTQWKVLPSRDTQFQTSKKELKRPRVDLNHFQKLCSGFWWLEDSQLKLNSTNSKENGEKRANFWTKKSLSSLTFQTVSIQWPCSQWHCFTCKRTQNSSRLINKVSINQNIGNSITMILWTSWPSFQESLPLFTDTSTKTLSLSMVTTVSIGPPTSLTCWDTTILTWENVWEDTCQFTLTMKEVTSLLTPPPLSDLLFLILIFLTQLPLTVLLVHSTDWPTKNASSGSSSLRSITKVKDQANQSLKNSSIKPSAQAESFQVTDTPFSETLIQDSCIWRNLPTETSRTITFAISRESASKPFRESSERSERLKILIQTSMLTVDVFFNTTVILLVIQGMAENDFYTCVFAVSRALGCLSSGIWARAFGLPIERPNSINISFIEKLGQPQQHWFYINLFIWDSAFQFHFLINFWSNEFRI